ncbi:polysaccharide deacetylase family protein [Fimbriiglobus ruber]|uniref:Polysaccharide deacetylase n=1 Tax=Fimbriiglobus ruber TaxID=1908690 RepID=A0A225DGD5_9BACT|nr:polysaccharide deacetylase family protein [Fimbriiglobus ruber]OWK37588.1 Polysaccharide deacetylase [Fimbriiglobus ruber]
MNLTRRQFLTAALAGTGMAAAACRSAAESDQALVAITLDLEMSRNFPAWDDTHWDYEKGNLNAETKRYAVEACKRVKAAGGVLHCFAVGQTFEQENVDWLKEIVKGGHPVGNHTYDHVNVTATKPADLQFRFQRAPWLIEGKPAADVIRENVRLTTAAMKARLGIEPAGFRTPGGFSAGLRDRPDLRRLFRESGFTWVSSLYPPHKTTQPREQPGVDVYDSIVRAQAAAQPFAYPDGLVEVPMSPISDIGAFRGGRWKLEWFLKAVRLGVEWAIEHRATFDFLGHPSCLYVTDPEFRTIDLICDLVRKAGDRAAIVDLGTLAARGRLKKDGGSSPKE